MRGILARRFWQPICFADELRDLPLRARIFREDLVVFRDFRGAVGLLELHCPHPWDLPGVWPDTPEQGSGAYHGWLFDVDGAILRRRPASRHEP